MRAQDLAGFFKHEIFWARNDEKVANCATTESDCYNYLLAGAKTPGALQMTSTNTYLAASHQFQIVTSKLGLEWRAEIGLTHWVFHTVSHQGTKGDGTDDVFWKLRSWQMTITDPCDAKGDYEFSFVKTMQVQSGKYYIKRANVGGILPGYVKSSRTDISNNVNVLRSLKFRFTNSALYDDSNH